MRTARVFAGVFALATLLCGGVAARSEPTLTRGQRVETTLRVTNTWVFCDEAKYGSYVMGRGMGTFLWVKLPPKYRWLTSTRLARATNVRVRGIAVRPRGDGYQVEEGVILSVDGAALGSLGLAWNAVAKQLFGTDVTDAMRELRWRRLKGKKMAEVGRVVELDSTRSRLKVKFRDSTWTWDAELRLTRPVPAGRIESFCKGAFVAIEGVLADYTTVNDAVTLSSGSAAVVKDMTGSGWSRLR